MYYYENLKEARIKRGMTQCEVAEIIGTSQKQMTRWETGKNEITITKFRELCELYMEYYERMREIRKSLKWTQTKTAEKMEISQQHYQQYERGIHEMPIRYLKTFCIITGSSADEILEIK